MKINVYHRKLKEIFQENVALEKLMTLSWENPIGFFITTQILAKKWISYLFGRYMDTALSRIHIQPFIKKMNVPLDEMETLDYRSFNEFFFRKLKKTSRPLGEGIISPSDGRVLVFPKIEEDSLFYVKWAPIPLKELFVHPTDDQVTSEMINLFRGGSAVVLRLCPTDYHRYHFPVEGIIKKQYEVDGLYYSVSPFALQKKVSIFQKNKRTITLIQSKEYGHVAMIEVGALFVGSIIQTFSSLKNSFSKGEEKGHFKFGGSCILLFFEGHKIVFDKDLQEKSAEGIETLVQMGESIGHVTPSKF